ncbi:MAG: rRNA pseudouridine synthase [bacterium]|nr:rRNA pseudouridine synthase [bacterium]
MSAQRLQKLLASSGLASRREAEDWVRAGRVSVNGKVAELGARADPSTDDIRVDGERLRISKRSYWLVHKPRDVLTTTSDPWAGRQGRRTVLDLLPPETREARLHPVGRLDAESEGLVLLTNDGELTQALLHPSLGNEREYQVTVRGQVEAASVQRLRTGIRLEDGPTQPWKVRVRSVEDDGRSTRVDVVLREGRKHQIRRAFRALGNPVQRLRRTRMGPLKLGRLARGRARELTADEVRSLHEHAGRLREQPKGVGRRKAKRRPGRKPGAADDLRSGGSRSKSSAGRKRRR